MVGRIQDEEVQGGANKTSASSGGVLGAAVAEEVRKAPTAVVIKSGAARTAPDRPELDDHLLPRSKALNFDSPQPPRPPPGPPPPQAPLGTFLDQRGSGGGCQHRRPVPDDDDLEEGEDYLYEKDSRSRVLAANSAAQAKATERAMLAAAEMEKTLRELGAAGKEGGVAAGGEADDGESEGEGEDSEDDGDDEFDLVSSAAVASGGRRCTAGDVGNQ